MQQQSTAKRMNIDQYCQRQRCKHVELEQFWHAFASRMFVSDSWAFLFNMHHLTRYPHPVHYPSLPNLAHITSSQSLSPFFTPSPFHFRLKTHVLQILSSIVFLVLFWIAFTNFGFGSDLLSTGSFFFLYRPINWLWLRVLD